MGSSCTFPTLFFFSPFRVGAYQFLFPWRSPPNAKLPLPPSAAAAVPPAHTSMGNTWHHLKGPFLNSPLVFRHFLLLQRRIPSSSYSQLFWKKFKGRELVCVPLLPVKWFLSPSTPAPDCCTLLWWVIYTDVFNCAGGPYFYVLFLRLRLRFYSSVAFSSPLCCCYKKILSTDSSSSGRFSSGVSAVIVGKL